MISPPSASSPSLKELPGSKEAAPAGAEQHEDADEHNCDEGASAEHRGLALQFAVVEHHAPGAGTLADDPGYVATEPQCTRLEVQLIILTV